MISEVFKCKLKLYCYCATLENAQFKKKLYSLAHFLCCAIPVHFKYLIIKKLFLDLLIPVLLICEQNLCMLTSKSNMKDKVTKEGWVKLKKRRQEREEKKEKDI